MRRFVRLSTLVALVGAAACQDTGDPISPAPGVEPRVEFSQQQLGRWFEVASPAVLALPRAVFADHDEANNRLLFGVENSAVIPGVQNALTALGIPSSAYAVQVTEPIHQVASLRDLWRPTQGGIQIHFHIYLCTLGFNADDAGERSFITNSHCTKSQGGVEGTEYFQPSSSDDPAAIAVEVEDPTYFQGSPCPRGRKCRYSDAARALYSSSVASTQGSIAKTSGPNSGSLEVTGAFSVTSQDNATVRFSSGTTVNKVGRTTGWTQGNTTNTCVNTNVSGSNITQLCQTFVQHPNKLVLVGGGDSGSGVFRITSGDNVQLVGILWGGNSSGTLFVFSPLKQIQDELGALSTTK